MELAELLQRAQSLSETGASPTTFDRAAVVNGLDGDLGELDCPKCRNKGWVAYNDGDGIVYEKCDCMPRRAALKRIRESGLSALLEDYRLDNYETPEPWQESALTKARQYAETPGAHWLYIFGPSGTGKSHLCTAVCGALLDAGQAVRYMLWRDESRDLKALVNDSAAYNRAMHELKGADILYIDDFLKGGTGDADKRLAFELLNSRYNSRRPTLISSELSIDAVLDWDEAIGSRIYERAKGYVIHANGQNWRLR